MLQSKAGYIDAKPLTASSAKQLATHGRTIHRSEADFRRCTAGPYIGQKPTSADGQLPRSSLPPSLKPHCGGEPRHGSPQVPAKPNPRHCPRHDAGGRRNQIFLFGSDELPVHSLVATEGNSVIGRAFGHSLCKLICSYNGKRRSISEQRHAGRGITK